MQDWKIRQEIYHRLTQHFDDDLNDKDITISDEIVDNAVLYFTTTDVGWIYPAKSYMVAICYSRWIAEHFGQPVFDLLNDPMLLYGNDMYFVPYLTDKDSYDRILEKIGSWNFDETKGMVPDVKQYFLQEFMIENLGQKSLD